MLTVIAGTGGLRSCRRCATRDPRSRYARGPVSPGTSPLVAALVAVCAVLVACAAVLVVLLARWVNGRASGATERLRSLTSAVGREAPAARHRLTRAADRTDALRERWRVADRTLDGPTGSLAAVRGSIESMTQGRLAGLIRAAGLVSRAAQVALLWR